MTAPPPNTTGAPMAVRSTSSAFRVECRYCGWGDHNTTWHEQHEQQIEQQAEDR